jgi:hypothetical protein
MERSGMSNNYGPRIVTDGLVLCLDAADRNSYPLSGNIWYDLSGNNNHATIHGPVFNSGNGGHFDLNGSTHYMSIISSASLQMTEELTLVTVFSPDQFAINRARFMDTSEDGSSGSTGASFYFKMGTGSPYQDISFFLNPSGGTTNATEVKRTVSIIDSVSKIYHVSARWRKSDGTSNIFVNGIEPSYALNNSFTSTLNTLVNPITIGKLEFTPSDIFGDQQTYLNLIYNRYLTNDEISQNYNATTGRFGL